MKVLGIESSCDETGIAVVEDGRRILSNIVASQVDIHARYGGIVPEVASRQHILSLVPALREALSKAGLELSALDAVAVTHGPGLAGSLLVGVNFAKGLAMALGVPLIGTNHLEGHIYAAWLEPGDPEAELGFPLMCLIASGGHTDLILMEGHGRYRLLGRTRDDAAGEAFDKAARVLGLGFPGGPEIQRASQGIKEMEPFPRPLLRETLDFSFSGLKTALLHRAQERGLYPPRGEASSIDVGRIAAGFQEALVDVMVERSLEAARMYSVRGVLIGGGVAANSRLRERIKELSFVPVLVPRPPLCTDNGAMIAACAYFRLRAGERNGSEMDVRPNFPLGL